MPATLEDAFNEFDQLAQEARTPKPRTAPIAAPVVAPPPPKAPPAKKPSLMDSAKGALKAFQADPVGQTTDAMKGFNASILRAPGQLAGGLVDTSADVGIFIGKNIDAAFVRNGYKSPGLAASGKRVYGASLADRLSFRDTLGQYGNKAVNQFSTEALASSIPLTKGTSVAKRLVGVGLASGAAMSADAGDVRSRANNALVGAAFEGGGELLLRGGQALYRTVIKHALPEDAAQAALDRSFATQRTTEARTKAQEAQLTEKPLEPTPQEELPTGTRHNDAAPKAPKEALIDDANHALKQSGAAHTVTPENLALTPDGKIKVPAPVKAAADEAGHGGAFADMAREDKPAVIFKEEASDGSSRVVGSMERESLINFGADVAHLRDNPGEINLAADSPHGQWTMAHLGSESDAAPVLRAVVEGIPGQARPFTDGELMEQAAHAADAMGSSPEDALAFARDVAGEQGDAHVALKALQTIWTRMGQDLDGITRGVDWNTAGEDLVEQAAQAIHDLHMFSTAFEETKTGAGRALRVLSLPDADAYLSGLKKGMRDPNFQPVPTGAGNPPPLPRTRQELKDWIDMWNAMNGNPTGQAALLKGLRSFPSGSMYLRTAFANFFTGAILSGPKTILLNVVQPAIMGGLRTLERTAGAGLGSINPLLSGTERQAFRDVALQAPVAYLQSLGDIADAFRSAAHTFGQNHSTLGGENPLDFNAEGIPQALIDAAERGGDSTIPYHLGNLLNLLPQAVFRLHGTTNEVALHVAYMGEVRAKAALEASTEGLTGPAFNSHIALRLSQATDATSGAALDAAALDSAHRTTMVRPPQEEFTPGYASFSNTIQAWRKNVPELRYVLPIFQVPANALGETIRRIPGAGFLLKETRRELTGEFGAMRKAEAYGRMMLGAGVLTAGSMMARNGMMTGAGPQDPRDRALWLTTHQPYSFRMGDEWVSYDKMDPAGPLLAIAAGHYDTSVYRDTDRDTTMAAVGALAEYLKDKAALKGISDLLNIGGSPQDASKFNQVVGGIARGFVPAFLQPVRTGLDPDLHTKRNPWDYIMDALPGASKSLDPVRNLLGEDVHKPQDTLAENILPVTLSPVNSFAKDSVLDELDRLYSKTGYTPGTLSPAAGAQAHFDYRDVKLEGGKSLYNALMQARTTSTIDGRTLRDALQDLYASAEYGAAPDGTGRTGDADEGPREDTRGGMVQKVFSAYTAQTKQDVARESPIAARWMAVAKIKSDANDQLRGTPAKDLVRDPKLLDALGISVDAYEAKLKGDQ